MSKAEKKPAKTEKKSPAPVVARKPVATWNDIGDGFETLGKVGLALAIGLSAAGLFCRLADQGKVRVPTLSGLVLNRGDQGQAQNQAQAAAPAKAAAKKKTKA